MSKILNNINLNVAIGNITGRTSFDIDSNTSTFSDSDVTCKFSRYRIFYLLIAFINEILSIKRDKHNIIKCQVRINLWTALIKLKLQTVFGKKPLVQTPNGQTRLVEIITRLFNLIT